MLDYYQSFKIKHFFWSHNSSVTISFVEFPASLALNSHLKFTLSCSKIQVPTPAVDINVLIFYLLLHQRTKMSVLALFEINYQCGAALLIWTFRLNTTSAAGSLKRNIQGGEGDEFFEVIIRLNKFVENSGSQKKINLKKLVLSETLQRWKLRE